MIQTHHPSILTLKHEANGRGGGGGGEGAHVCGFAKWQPHGAGLSTRRPCSFVNGCYPLLSTVTIGEVLRDVEGPGLGSPIECLCPLGSAVTRNKHIMTRGRGESAQDLCLPCMSHARNRHNDDMRKAQGPWAPKSAFLALNSRTGDAKFANWGYTNR